ncbi:hypothetical protein QHL1GM_16150 [Halomonas sp. QHL1]|nr:hypothetical protein QHL1GM_16150 [Halomonas sp. QHL1]
MIEFSDTVRKMKTNVILVSFISLFMTLGGVEIDPESTFFGLKFTGLSSDLIYSGLVVVLFYLMAHFVWCAYETLQEWEVRVTGTKGAFKRADQEDIDEAIHPSYPSDPRNSTLYYSWSTQAHKISCVRSDIESANKKILELEAVVHGLREQGTKLSRDTVNISTSVDPLKDEWQSIKRSIQAIEKTISADQVIDSMRVFDRRYKYFMKTQNIRWFVIDFIFPIVLSSVAIYKMIDALSL